MNLTRKEIEALLRGEKSKRLASEGFTTEELGKMLGLKYGAASRHVREGIESGLMEYAGRKEFHRIDGAKSSKPAYKLTGVKK